MALQDATNLRCANLARHPRNQQPPAVAFIHDPCWGPNTWRQRCRDCLDALGHLDGHPFQVAKLCHHEPPADHDHDPFPNAYVAPI